MIKEFVKRFDEKRGEIRSTLGSLLKEKDYIEYEDIVRVVVEAVKGDHIYKGPDPDKITRIDGEDYQGTAVFVIGPSEYDGDDHWYVRISYGSCSVCDTLMRIVYDYKYGDKEDKEEAVNDLFTLALHIVQQLKKMEGEIV